MHVFTCSEQHNRDASGSRQASHPVTPGFCVKVLVEANLIPPSVDRNPGAVSAMMSGLHTPHVLRVLGVGATPPRLSAAREPPPPPPPRPRSSGRRGLQQFGAVKPPTSPGGRGEEPETEGSAAQVQDPVLGPSELFIQDLSPYLSLFLSISLSVSLSVSLRLSPSLSPGPEVGSRPEEFVDCNSATRVLRVWGLERLGGARSRSGGGHGCRTQRRAHPNCSLPMIC